MSLFKRVAAATLVVGVLILTEGYYLITYKVPSVRNVQSPHKKSNYSNEDSYLIPDVNANATGILEGVIPPNTKQLARRAARVQQMNTKRWKQAIDKYFIQHTKLCRQWEKITHVPPLPYCPCIPGNFTGYRDVVFRVQDFTKILADNPHVKAGGHWYPSNCSSRFSLAIIIPFRDRAQHLAILLAQLHPFLQRQLANYTIYVVEQRSPVIFNKAIMMNTGFLFAKRTRLPDCVIFHDVDTIPEDDRHFYTCVPTHVLHIGSHLDVRNYKLAYPTSFGGITSYTRRQFELVNGFSNNFFGWGGEDDNMGGRVRRARLKKMQHPMEVAGYSVVPHVKDAGNRRPPNYWSRRRQLHESKDGLSTLRVNITTVEQRPLYTWLHVDVLHKVMAR